MRARAMDESERSEVGTRLREFWGSERVVSRGRVLVPGELPAIVAEEDGRVVGVLAYEVRRDEFECVTVTAFEQGRGAGGALLDAAAEEARRHGCRRLWLITTNDNTPALRFYQRRGMRLVALHRDAVSESRRLKPEIPLTGVDGIAIRDELELELPLRP